MFINPGKPFAGNPKFSFLLVCLIFVLASCVTKQVVVPPNQEETSTLEPTSIDPTTLPTIDKLSFEQVLIESPTPDIKATKFPNSRLCETEKYQGDYLTSFRREYGESPDRIWLFVQCYENDEEVPNHYVLYNQIDQSETQMLEFSEIINNPHNWYAFGWTKDSQHFFLGYHEFCEFPGTCQYIDVKALFRLNPVLKEFSPILPFRDDKRQYAIAISHNVNILAYTVFGSNILYLRNLSENVDNEIVLDQNQYSIGKMAWSPNDRLLLFRSSPKEDVFDYSHWLLNTTDSSIKQLLPNDDSEYSVAGWLDNNIVLLYKFSVGANGQFKFTYNIQSGELLVFEE